MSKPQATGPDVPALFDVNERSRIEDLDFVRSGFQSPISELGGATGWVQGHG